MTRRREWIFDGLAAASLMLCVAASILWARSYRTSSSGPVWGACRVADIAGASKSQVLVFDVYRGHVIVSADTSWSRVPSSSTNHSTELLDARGSRFDIFDLAPATEPHSTTPPPQVPAANKHFLIHLTMLCSRVWAFHDSAQWRLRADTFEDHPGDLVIVRALTFPAWCLVLVAALAPAARGRNLWRRRSAPSRGKRIVRPMRLRPARDAGPLPGVRQHPARSRGGQMTARRWRWALQGPAALSLGLSVGASALWCRTYAAKREIAWPINANYQFEATARYLSFNDAPRQYAYDRERDDLSSGMALAVSSVVHTELQRIAALEATADDVAKLWCNGAGLAACCARLQEGDAAFARLCAELHEMESCFNDVCKRYEALRDAPPRHVSYRAPYVLAVPATAIAPLVWWAIALVRRRRGRSARHRGVCLVCGYDLRATPARCPECGTDPAARTLP